MPLRFEYLLQHRVLVCVDCGAAVRQLQRHLLRDHPECQAEHQELIARYQQHELARPEEVPLPPPGQPAIEILGPAQPAFACMYEECLFVAVTEGGVRQHARRVHRWSGRDRGRRCWREVMAQRFFTARDVSRWFAVSVQPPPPAVDRTGEQGFAPPPLSHHVHPPLPTGVWTLSTRPPLSRGARPGRVLTADENADLEAMAAEWQALTHQHQEEMQTQDAEILKQDKTGWWTLTKWPEHFRGRHLEYLAHASRVPDKDDQLLQEAMRICTRTLQRATVGLSTLHRELRRWLRSPKPEEVAGRPLARLEDDNSQDRYYNYWRRFICYSIRVYVSQQAHEAGARAVRAETDRRPTDEGDEDESERASESESSSFSDDSEDHNDWERVEPNRPASRPGDQRRPSTPPNIRDPMLDARELFPWTDGQKGAIQSFYNQLALSGDPDDEGRNRTLEELLIKVYREFIFHQWTGDEYESGLIHYCAILGIDADAHRLRRASDYSYMMAGMVWCVRVLAGALLLPPEEREEQRTDPRHRERFMEGRRLFLTDGSGTAVSVMLSWLAYGKYITMNTGNDGAVAWSADRRVLIYRGTRIGLTSFTQMVRELVRDTHNMLWEKLMWVTEPRRRFGIALGALEDDVSFTHRGYSFIQREGNRLHDGGAWMRRQMVEALGRRQRLRVGGRWQPHAVRRWLKASNRFLEGLLLCVHITGGQPARGTEIMASRFRNGSLQDRNIFIIDGQVVVVTRYHKSQSQLDRPKVVPRFLPTSVGEMLVTYLVYVQPFREHLAVQVMKGPFSDHVWHDQHGPWETSRLTKALQHMMSVSLGHRFGTLDYRHIAVSIGREVVGERFGAGYQDEIGEVEEPEVEEAGGVEVQSGRGEVQGSLRYGVPIDIVQHMSARSLAVFRPLSAAWHRFLGLAPAARDGGSCGRTSSTSRKREVDGDDDDAVRAASRDRSRGRMRGGGGVPLPTRLGRPWAGAGGGEEEAADGTASKDGLAVTGTGVDEDAVLTTLRRVLGDEQAEFRSAAQREAMMAVLRGETPVVVVLPTGGGKTLLATLPAHHDLTGVSVFVAPFRALVNNMVDRFQREGIHAVEWRPGQRNPARLVVVSADIAVQSTFTSYCQLLHLKGLLRTVYFDEVHLAFTAHDWRPKLEHLQELRSLACQQVMLTATLPPSKVVRLEVNLALRHARYVRMSTARPMTRYLVQRCPAKDVMSRAVAVARRQMAHFQEQTAGLKGVVYAKSRATCEALADELGCPFYHAHDVQRATQLARWEAQGGLVVATSALGTGVDYPGVVFTLHVELPWTMIDFAQESGRAGRGGEVVDAVIVAAEHGAEQQLRAGRETSSEATAMLEFVAGGGCRRLVMSAYLDGAGLARSCGQISGGARCDRCGEGETAVAERGRTAGRQWGTVRGLLDELATGCVWCFMNNMADTTAWHTHGTLGCASAVGGCSTVAIERFRAGVRWADNSHSCHRCGISQRFCATGEDVGRECQWGGVVMPMLMALWQSSERGRVMELAGVAERPSWGNEGAFRGWVGQRHGQTVWQEWMSNGMMLVIRLLLLHERTEERIRAGAAGAEGGRGELDVDEEGLQEGVE